MAVLLANAGLHEPGEVSDLPSFSFNLVLLSLLNQNKDWDNDSILCGPAFHET